MSRFYTDKNAMTCPWTMSPFFYKLLENDTSLNDEQKALAKKFYEDGYVTIDLNLSDDIIEKIKNDVAQNVGGKTQDEGYHYSQNPRVFEAWKWSESVRDIANNPKVISTLEMLFDRKALPFQTINFRGPTNQPIHSDAIHFSTTPSGWVAACWVAFEDMSAENGTLGYVPGSHHWPEVDFTSIGLGPTKYGEQFKNYAEYEEFTRRLMEAKGVQPTALEIKKGSALIWSANLLHGGTPVENPEKISRLSQATHYYFEGCDHYYAPMFSNPLEGLYSEKDLTSKNIRGEE